RFAQHLTPDPGGSALTSGLGGRPSGFDGSTSAQIWAAHIWAYGPLYALSAFKPRPWLELGLSRTAQWCGEGRPCDLETFGRLLVGRDNRSDTLRESEEPGNQMAGYDVRVRSPWRTVPAAFYGQLIGEDEAGGAAQQVPRIAGRRGLGGRTVGLLAAAH